MKILVTGSEGMLGSALIRSLESRDIETEGIDIRSQDKPVDTSTAPNHGPQAADTSAGSVSTLSPSTKAQGSVLSGVEGLSIPWASAQGGRRVDITKSISVTEVINSIKPDLVIHTAAYTDVDGCESNHAKAFLVNGEGTKNVAFACHEARCAMIYISTDYIFDGKSESAYKEEDETAPINVYGSSKLAGEDFVKSISQNYLIIRTSWLFGEGGRNFVDSILALAQAGKRLRVVDDQKGSPTYTIDLSEAIAGLLLKIFAGNKKDFQAPFNILNMTNSGSCSWYEFAKEILKQKGIKGTSVTPVTSADINRPAKRPAMSVLDNSRFIKFYGKPMPLWQDALRRYLNSSL